MEEITQLNGQSVNLLQEMEEVCRENEELKKNLADLTVEMKHFTYIVSHDLQTPLRSITGFMELLEKRYADKLDDAARKYIDFAVKGTAKMKGLISDLLEYARLSTDTSELTETDMTIVVKDVIEKFMPGIIETGAEISIGHLPVVMAKKTQMEQLFQHLVENALKFRSTATLKINIYSEKKNGFWVIAVKDNGMGIDPAYFEKIFIIFRRLHADETKYSGRGFGLAACKKIIELHGGSICVNSALDKGSTFSFTLPSKT